MDCDRRRRNHRRADRTHHGLALAASLRKIVAACPALATLSRDTVAKYGGGFLVRGGLRNYWTAAPAKNHRCW